MVANLGITSQMALFLSEEPGLRASLNLYAKSSVDLDQDALEVAQLFANAAAGVLGMVRTVEQAHRGAGNSPDDWSGNGNRHGALHHR